MGWAFVLLVYVSVVCKFSQNFIFLKVFFSGYFFPLELHFKKTFVLQFFSHDLYKNFLLLVFVFPSS